MDNAKTQKRAWSAHALSAWERTKEALRRDWAQTKFDLGLDKKGVDLEQGAIDTVQQAAGTTPIPPRNVTTPHDAFAAVRYGYLAATSSEGASQEWSFDVEADLARTWPDDTEPFPWSQALPHVKYGWDYALSRHADAVPPVAPPDNVKNADEVRLSEDAKQEQLADVVKSFDTAMFLVLGTSHARPLTIADVNERGEISFATSISTPKIDELVRNRSVVVLFQGARKYVSLTGTATVTQDRREIDRLWKESWRIFFSGKDDPELCLIRVKPLEGEYWDLSGTAGLRYWFDAATALLFGEKKADHTDDRTNATASFANSTLPDASALRRHPKFGQPTR